MFMGIDQNEWVTYYMILHNIMMKTNIQICKDYRTIFDILHSKYQMMNNIHVAIKLKSQKSSII